MMQLATRTNSLVLLLGLVLCSHWSCDTEVNQQPIQVRTLVADSMRIGQSYGAFSKACAGKYEEFNGEELDWNYGKTPGFFDILLEYEISVDDSMHMATAEASDYVSSGYWVIRAKEFFTFEDSLLTSAKLCYKVYGFAARSDTIMEFFNKMFWGTMLGTESTLPYDLQIPMENCCLIYEGVCVQHISSEILNFNATQILVNCLFVGREQE